MALAGRGRKRRCAFDSRHGYGVELRLTARLVNLLSDQVATEMSNLGIVRVMPMRHYQSIEGTKIWMSAALAIMALAPPLALLPLELWQQLRTVGKQRTLAEGLLKFSLFAALVIPGCALNYRSAML